MEARAGTEDLTVAVGVDVAYPLTALIVQETWGTVLRAAFVPHLQMSTKFFYILTAVIDTVISPCMLAASVSARIVCAPWSTVIPAASLCRSGRDR